VDIREMRPEEWRSLKDLRLRALETDPDAFGSTFAEERVKPVTAWQEWAAEGWGLGAQTTLVALVGDRCLGMGVCIVAEAEPRSATVYAMWVYPQPVVRGSVKNCFRNSSSGRRSRTRRNFFSR